MNLTASKKAYALIKEFEGLRLESYRDSAGYWTIGYGHRRNAGPAQTISEATAEVYLRQDVSRIEGILSSAIRAPIGQSQFDACVSLAFNIGAGAFASSTLLRKLNAGDLAGAASEFGRWNHSAGQILDGLTRRREAERLLFEEGAVSANQSFLIEAVP